MQHLLDLKLEIHRHYLQGTDLFVATEKCLKSTLDSNGFIKKIIFKRFSDKQCCITTLKPSNKSEVVSNGFFFAGGQSVPFWLLETNVPVQGRYTYDESPVISGAVFDRNLLTATMPTKGQYQPINHIVALTKALHLHCYSLKEGQWVFGQLDLDSELIGQSLLAMGKNIEVKITSAIQGKFTVVDVYFDHKIIAIIRFIWKPK